MTSVGVLGSGFGIYGYLASFSGTGIRVVTLERYKKVIESRSEIDLERIDIQFVGSEPELVSESQAIAVVRRPLDQYLFLQEFGASDKHYFLEKPLGMTIRQHERIVEQIRVDDLSASVAYLFRETNWYKNVLQGLMRGMEFKINWSIAQSSVLSWKQDATQGGGPASFYFIHFAPLLSALGNWQGFSLRQGDGDSIVLLADGRLSIGLRVGNINNFSVAVRNPGSTTFEVAYEDEGPFGTRGIRGKVDSRIPYLRDYLMRHLGEKSVFDLDTERAALWIRETSKGLVTAS